MNNNFCFRKDIQIRMDIVEGAEVYTLGDPITNRHFRFKKIEYLIVKNLDGSKNLQELTESVQKEASIDLDEIEVLEFIKSLTSLGLIEGSEIRHVAPSNNLLYKKFKLFNPDKLFDQIIPYVSFLFTETFVKISIIFMILAFFIVLKRYDEIYTHIPPGDTPFMSFILTLLAMALIIGSHEFAHGLSLKKYGGKVPEIGFILILLLPAFYCDVSSAWMLDKTKKIFVTLAGGFYELVIGTIATIVWNFTEPYTWINDIAYIFMISSVFTVSFNFNPLIKLDGYYILSDYLEIPNLRAEAFNYMKVMFRLSKATRVYPEKEKQIFTIYGPLSFLFTIFMLWFLYSLVSNFLADTLKFWGILLSMVLFVLIIKQIMKGALKLSLSQEK